MEPFARLSREIMRHLTVVVMASLFSVGLYQIWDFKTRWFVVAVAGIAMVSIAMCFAAAFSEFLLIAFLFALPVASFDKWFWPSNYLVSDRGNLVYAGVVGVGVLDFILAGLSLSWFYRVFIVRIQPLPKLYPIDLCIVGFLFVHLLASIGSVDPKLALGATEYLFKYVVLYFYLSRNLRPAHLKWIIAAMCMAIFMEAGFGLFQHHTGKLLGFALDKGAGGSTLNYEYKVPGVSATRATGTAYDSHALGNFVGMILPFPLIFVFTPWVKGRLRIVLAIVAVLAMLTIALSFSRSAWLGSAIALTIGVILILNCWKEGTVIPIVGVCALLFVLSAPWTMKAIANQFRHARYTTFKIRLEQFRVALTIWQMHPILGVGPGNYINALRRYDYLWLAELPVHNVMLWIVTETGIVGLLFYLGTVFSAMKRLLRTLRRRRDEVGRVAMAALIGLLALFLDGLTEPLFREPTVFATFWLLISLAVALPTFD